MIRSNRTLYQSYRKGRSHRLMPRYRWVEVNRLFGKLFSMHHKKYKSNDINTLGYYLEFKGRIKYKRVNPLGFSFYSHLGPRVGFCTEGALRGRFVIGGGTMNKVTKRMPKFLRKLRWRKVFYGR